MPAAPFVLAGGVHPPSSAIRSDVPTHRPQCFLAADTLYPFKQVGHPPKVLSFLSHPA